MPKCSKYVIVNNFGLEMPIVFNPIIDHSGVVPLTLKPVSAGFCHRSDDGTIQIYGESVSLHLKSRPEDKELIEKYLEWDF